MGEKVDKMNKVIEIWEEKKWIKYERNFPSLELKLFFIDIPEW